MDQVVAFVGRNTDLPNAVREAQNAANSWLHQHNMSIGTVYSSASQSVWEPRGKGAWYHVITITLEYRGPALPPTLPSSGGEET
jgi:hypothetical protein